MMFDHPVYDSMRDEYPFPHPRWGTTFVINDMSINGTSIGFETPSRPQDQLAFAEGMLSVQVENYAATDNEAIVELGVALGNEAWQVQGSARRARGDIANRDAALLLSLSRALSTVARHIEKHAEGAMKHDADVQAHRKVSARRVKQ